MAPPPQTPCSVPECVYLTPQDLPTWQMVTDHLKTHTSAVHGIAPPPATTPAGQTAKLDKRLRPTASLGMTELDWRFYKSEWGRYTRQTGVTEQALRDELWNTMDTDLRQLAFSEGGDENLNTEDALLDRIKSLAVTVLHPSVHIVTLHGMSQNTAEPVKAFSARVKGTAANCKLTKKCPTDQHEVSYMEETVYHVVMSGIKDQDLKDQTMTQAMLGNITDLKTLVDYCTAAESKHLSGNTVGRLRRSSYKEQREGSRSPQPAKTKCGFCGGKVHGDGGKAAREKTCKAFNQTCTKCKKKNHFAPVCKSAQNALLQAEDSEIEDDTALTGAFGLHSISFLPSLDQETSELLDISTDDDSNDEDQEDDPLTYEVSTQNRFANLTIEPDVPKYEKQSSPLCPPLRASKPRPSTTTNTLVDCNNNITTMLDTSEESIPIPLDMEPPSRLAHLSPIVNKLRAANNGPVTTVPLPHIVHDTLQGWYESRPRSSPTYNVEFSLHSKSYADLGLNLPIRSSKKTRSDKLARDRAIFDTGAQMNVTHVALLKSLGINQSNIFPIKSKVGGPSGEPITILGGVILKITATNHDGTKKLSTVQLFYVSTVVQETYLSLETCIALGTVPRNFPSIGEFDGTAVLNMVNSINAAHDPVSEQTMSEPGLPPCSNTGLVQPGDKADKPCSCPNRTLPPTDKPVLPCEPTPENLPRLKQYILDRFASSAFNTCEYQEIPLMNGSPPLRLHVDPKAIPVAVHTPVQVPIHYKDAVHEGLLRDVRLGVLEKTPLNQPAKWQSRMLIQPKPTGEPRRVIDYQAINAHAPRQTHHTESPWSLVSTIPAGVRKTVLDCRHGYHSVPIAEEDRPLTTFVTEWGRFHYKTTPQGFISAGDGYTDRMDRILSDFPRLKKCVDDNLLWDDDIQSNFFRVCDFLSLCSSHGMLFGSKKFQFASESVKFVGFNVTDTGIKPTQEFIDNINNFPTPKSLTDIRSWFGAVAQISFAFATAPVMLPFRHLLSSKVPFSWSPDLDSAFKASKLEIVRQIEKGVRTFDPSKPTALATDWSKFGMGFWLCQKHCDCEQDLPGCCPSGWQTVLCGSRFCTPAESRYAPIEGEATAAAWGLDKCRFFLLGMSEFQLCLDHKPLLSILGKQELATIANPRLQNQKIKTLLFRHKTAYIPGKKHVTADCLSRRSDSPVSYLPQPPTQPFDDISNVQPQYQDELGPPTWVHTPTNLNGSLTSSDEYTIPHQVDYALLALQVHQPHTQLTRDHEENDGLFAPLRVPPTALECQESSLIEEILLARAQASLSELDTLIIMDTSSLAGIHTQQRVVALTWDRLEAAARDSPVYQKLHSIISNGPPEDKSAWPVDLRPYFPHRHVLVPVGAVLLYHDRPVIPVLLRQEVLDHLHAGHQAVTQMYSRASSSVFWPNLRQDIIQTRGACKECTYNAPSNPAPPPSEPHHPDYPFASVCADFFTVNSVNYLSIVDRYTGWLSIYHLKKDDSAHVIEVLREYSARWGIPDTLTTDGASVFVSHTMNDFLTRWGIHHRVSSAYYPRANKRAEIGVKSAKRLIMSNLGPGGTLNTDKLARALLFHRNCPDPLTGLSPAQVIFGRVLRDHLPAQVIKYKPRAEWRLEADMREKTFAKRHLRTAERLSLGAKQLPTLVIGDIVAVQDMTDPCKPGKWTKTAIVIEILGHESYLLKIHGSNVMSKRNRRHLRKITPYQSVIQDSPQPRPAYSPPVTRGQSSAPPPGLSSPSPATATPPPPTLPSPPTAETPKPPPTQSSDPSLPSPASPSPPPGQSQAPPVPAVTKKIKGKLPPHLRERWITRK